MPRPTYRRTFCTAACALLLASAFFAGAAAAAEGEREPAWTARDVVTTVTFNAPLLTDLGIEVTELTTTAPAVVQHPLSVIAGAAPAFAATAPWSLRFAAPGGRFDGFLGGSVRHQGGFELRWDGGSASLLGFELRPGTEPRTLELLSATGDLLFVGDQLHFEIDTAVGVLRIFNVDLRIARPFAERLGRKDLVDHHVGLLSLTAAVDVPEGVEIEGTCPDNWDGDVDVRLINLGAVSQIARSGGQVVMTPSATLKNVGTADVPWYSKFSGNFPPYGNDQHPFLVWSVFRESENGFEQLAVSGVKHAFLTINSNCTGCSSDSHILGLGCEDVYGVGTNSSNGSLAPREEITAHTGIWAHCDEPSPNTISHFDQDGNCSQDHSGQGENAFSHGLVVDESELDDAGVRYYFYAWYVVRKDVNIFNTMAWREINPTFGGSSWSFPFLTSLDNSSPVDAWVDPDVSDPMQLNRTLSSAEGHLQLAVKARELSAVETRFDYALMNHDYDRQVQTFSVPIDPSVQVNATTFHDLDDDPSNDWQVTINDDSIVWQEPGQGNSLDWGEMYSFSFEAFTETAVGVATLTPLEAGKTTEEQIPTLTAGTSTVIFADNFESGDTSAWTKTVIEP